MESALAIGGYVWKLIALLGILAGCAQPKGRIVRRLATNSETVPVPTCPTPNPTIPAEAVRQGIYGVVLAGYVVEPNGRVDQIELEDRRASPLLFEAVKEWLEQCQGQDETRGHRLRFSELLSFPPPQYTGPPAAETAEPVDEKSPGLTPPARSPNCLPDRPPPLVPIRGTLEVEYIVRSDGRVGDVIRKGGDAVAARLLKSVSIWLQACPYTPGTLDGRAVPVRVAQSFIFAAE